MVGLKKAQELLDKAPSDTAKVVHIVSDLRSVDWSEDSEGISQVVKQLMDSQDTKVHIIDVASPSRKIDRKALLKLPPPNIALSAPAGLRQNESSNQPRNEIERIVAAAWQDALGVPSVGMNDNFFDLGAHSLTVAEVQAKLQEALGREISIVDLFQFSTVTTLAGHLAGTQSRSEASDRAQRRRLARRH